VIGEPEIAAAVLRLVLWAAAGPLAGATALGLAAGLLQAVTGVQEPGLGFLARSAGAVLGLWALASEPLARLLELAARLWGGA